MNRRTKSIICAVVMYSFSGALAFAGGGLAIPWYTIDGGGGYSAGGSFELEGTIGQPDARAMTGGSFALSGGFWPGASAAPAVPGDCDGDGDVDVDDYTEMALCLLGPDSTLGSGCECLDFDSDNDIDLVDFAELQVEFTGN